MPESGSDITFTDRGLFSIVTITGEFDGYCAPLVRDALVSWIQDFDERKQVPYLIFDLTGVNFIDLGGVTVLAGAKRRLVALGGDGVLIQTDPKILKVFRITNIPYRIYGSMNEAIGALIPDST